MKLVAIVVIMLIALFCYFAFLGVKDSRSPSTKIAHQILGNVSRNLGEQYQMSPIGISESGGEEGYSSIGLTFELRKVVSKEKGRKMLVDSVNQLVEAFNNNPDIQKYLIDKPFTEKNIEITILSMGSDGRGVYYPDIQVFVADEGEVRYKTKSPSKEYGYHTIEEETFEEAVRIVESQRDK